MPDAITANTPLPVVAPEAARFLVGQQDKFASLWNANSKLFRSFADEAYRDEPEHAKKMFRDLQIRSLMAERLLPSTSLVRTVEPEDPKDEDQQHFAEKYSRILLKATPRFPDLCMCLGFSLFFGKYGVQLAPRLGPVLGRNRAWHIGDHQPWSGDKINWTWDGEVAVLVRTSWQYPGAAYLGLDSDKLQFPAPADFRMSDRAGGKYMVLRTEELRSRWIIQRACPVDRDFLTESDLAGQAYGEGLRSLIYWPWYMRERLKVWALDAVNRMGVNGMLYAFCESGNVADEQAVAKALADLVTDNIAVFKRTGGIDQQGITNIPPSPVAYEVIRSFIDYLDSLIKLAIIGQELSSGTEPTGMGSSVADFHRSTKEALVRSDVTRLDETLTTDALRPLMRRNGDDLGFDLRVVSRIDESDGLACLQKAEIAQRIGLLIDEDDIRDKSGLKKPDDPSHALKPPGSSVSMPGMPGKDGEDGPVGTNPPGPKMDHDPAPPRANYAAEHAPHDMTVAGREFKGGEFIPATTMDRATPAEKAAVEGKPAGTPGGTALDEVSGLVKQAESGRLDVAGAREALRSIVAPLTRGEFDDFAAEAYGSLDVDASTKADAVRQILRELKKRQLVASATARHEAKVKAGHATAPTPDQFTASGVYRGTPTIGEPPPELSRADRKRLDKIEKWADEGLPLLPDDDRILLADKCDAASSDGPCFVAYDHQNQSYELVYRWEAADASTDEAKRIRDGRYEVIRSFGEDGREQPVPNGLKPDDPPALANYAAYEPDDDDPGVMIALFPPEALADELAIPGGNDPDDLHVTLAYLGKVSEIGKANLPRVERAVKFAAMASKPLAGSIGGIGRFPASTSSDGMGVLYAGVDVPGLVELRQSILANLHGFGIEWKNNHGFTPHMTLDYVEPDAPLDLSALESRPATFRAVYLCYGDERIRIPLGMHARRTKDRLGRVRGGPMAVYSAELTTTGTGS